MNDGRFAKHRASMFKHQPTAMGQHGGTSDGTAVSSSVDGKREERIDGDFDWSGTALYLGE